MIISCRAKHLVRLSSLIQVIHDVICGLVVELWDDLVLNLHSASLTEIIETPAVAVANLALRILM